MSTGNPLTGDRSAREIAGRDATLHTDDTDLADGIHHSLPMILEYIQNNTGGSGLEYIYVFKAFSSSETRVTTFPATSQGLQDALEDPWNHQSYPQRHGTTFFIPPGTYVGDYYVRGAPKLVGLNRDSVWIIGSLIGHVNISNMSIHKRTSNSDAIAVDASGDARIDNVYIRAEFDTTGSEVYHAHGVRIKNGKLDIHNSYIYAWSNAEGGIGNGITRLIGTGKVTVNHTDFVVKTNRISTLSSPTFVPLAGSCTGFEFGGGYVYPVYDITGSENSNGELYVARRYAEAPWSGSHLVMPFDLNEAWFELSGGNNSSLYCETYVSFYYESYIVQAPGYHYCSIQAILGDGKIVEARLIRNGTSEIYPNSMPVWNLWIDNVQVTFVDNDDHYRAGVWYPSIHFDIGNSGSIELRLSGQTVLTYSGNTQPGVSNQIESIRFYHPAETLVVQWDDITIGTGGFPGGVSYRATIPGADSSPLEWAIDSNALYIDAHYKALRAVGGGYYGWIKTGNAEQTTYIQMDPFSPFYTPILYNIYAHRHREYQNTLEIRILDKLGATERVSTPIFGGDPSLEVDKSCWASFSTMPDGSSITLDKINSLDIGVRSIATEGSSLNYIVAERMALEIGYIPTSEIDWDPTILYDAVTSKFYKLVVSNNIFGIEEV
jgi:hypothetical protein